MCKKHPRYTGIYKPRNNCMKCWRIYAITHPYKAAKKFNDMSNEHQAYQYECGNVVTLS